MLKNHCRTILFEIQVRSIIAKEKNIIFGQNHRISKKRKKPLLQLGNRPLRRLTHTLPLGVGGVGDPKYLSFITGNPKYLSPMVPVLLAVL